MNFGIVVFPGSNCDKDCYDATYHLLGQETRFIWHQETDIKEFDCIILPGGFSYGDYLRSGAIAKTSPVMQALENYLDSKIIIGICNGFQILTEVGFLPGTLLKNKSLKFICTDVYLKVINSTTPSTLNYQQGQVIKMPIAHGDGSYYATEEQVKELKQNNQIVFQYCTQNGNTSVEANPNGSIDNIAGVCNKQGNIIGLMPHPERNIDLFTGNGDGLAFFESIIMHVQNRKLTYA